MTVVNPLNPLELLAGELAYACNNGICPCVSKENCPFDSQNSTCSDILFTDWIFGAENFSNNLYAEAKYARGE